MGIRAKLSVAAVMAAALLTFIPQIASAHAERTVGPFDLEIGFRDEPVYVGVPNAVFLELMKDGEEVADVGDSLTVTLGFGDQTSDPIVFEPMEEPGQFQGALRSIAGRRLHVHAFGIRGWRCTRAVSHVGTEDVR